MRHSIVCVALAAVVLAEGAQARSHAETAARALRSDPVYVHPGARERLPVGDRGRVRIAIVRHAIGRIKIAVVPERVAARSGSLEGFANDVDRSLAVRGALLVVAGPAYWVVTSYPRSDQAAAAVRAAVSARDDDPLVSELLAAVRRLGRVDPGPAEELRAPDVALPDGQEFLDDVADAFRVGVLIVAAAIALPFLIVATFLLVRVRRRRAQQEEIHDAGRRSADEELVAFGDEIRALDLDTSMPDADRAALGEYEQALQRYDQANELLTGERTPYRVEQARTTIAAGRRHVAAARERLG